MSRSWYILNAYTGYEGKIERTIKSLLEKSEIDPNVVLDVRVPLEEVVEIKDGKKRTRMNKFLPGYILLEMDLPELNWKETCTKLYKIQGVTGFVGNVSRNDRPVPIRPDEAKSLLQKSGIIKGEKQVHVRQSFDIDDVVKITDGAFASFTGTIKEINLEKEKLKVEVQIFGRSTPVEVKLLAGRENQIELYRIKCIGGWALWQNHLLCLFDVVWQIQGFVSQIQTILILFLGEMKVRWT